MATVPLLVVWMLHGVAPRLAFPKSNSAVPLALLIVASQFCAAGSLRGRRKPQQIGPLNRRFFVEAQS